MSLRQPSYRKHSSSDNAFVCIRGRRHYLGRYGSPESKEQYRRLLAQFWAGQPIETPRRGRTASHDPAAASVAEVCAAYLQHALTWYRDQDGQPTKTLVCVRVSLELLDEIFGDTNAADFGTSKLDALIREMIRRGWSRAYANKHVGTIKRVFRHAARVGLVSSSIWHDLQTVEGLRKGRTEAREPDAIGPVSDADVEATLPFLPAVVADMVRLQRLLGCRPGELVQMRPAEIDAGSEVWFYSPRTHKTAHHGKSRRIAIGPKAQVLLRPYLERPPEIHCFRPADSEAMRRADLRERRKTRLQPSQANRQPKAMPKRAPGDFYTVASYRQAIERAADRADTLAHRKQLGAKAEQRLVARWRPNQLRHSAASEVRREFGLEAAQVLLGHSRADVTQVYAERNDALAASVAAKIG